MQNLNGWTEERRTRQAALIHQWKPWITATGPRTKAGKAISSKNASKPNSLRKQLMILQAELNQVLRQMKQIEARRRM